MTEQRNITVCFSGHRRYASAEADQARLAAAVKEAYDGGYRTFVSGMARGFDLAAAAAVVQLRSSHCDVRFVAAVPFAGQAAKYPAEERAFYEVLLAAADRTHLLAERYSYGCYLRRDDWMVERSGRIICWYDGSKGGTRYTVRRAAKAGLEIVNLFRPEGMLF